MRFLTASGRRRKEDLQSWGRSKGVGTGDGRQGRGGEAGQVLGPGATRLRDRVV